MSKKTGLQERALEQELKIYHDPDPESGDAKELTIAELELLLSSHAEAMQTQADEAAAEKARVRESAAAEEERVASEVDAVDAEAEAAEVAAAKAADDAATAKVEPPVTAVPAKPAQAAEPSGAGSKKDKALAKEHGYPVVVAKGTAFRSNANVRCPLGGGLRRNGSVVILNAQYAKLYAAHITKL